jgi:Rrf2 family protein
LMAGEPGRRRAVREVAEELGVSEAHLAKVFQRLSRAGLVTSRRGPGGGFLWARDPGSVSLLEVYEAVEGPYRGQVCLFAVPRCTGTECLLGGLLNDVSDTVRARLAGTTMAAVAQAPPVGDGA